jgi:fluoroacetyl-CoA thioesterase
MPKPGLEATVEETVTEAMTAERLGSGDLPVLGTPAVLALVEAAAVAAVDVALDVSTTTVGASVKLDHVAPTAVGRSVTATAALIEVDGRRLRFRFEVTDEAGPVAHGEHARVIVDREAFLQDARERG